MFFIVSADTQLGLCLLVERAKQYIAWVEVDLKGFGMSFVSNHHYIQQSALSRVSKIKCCVYTLLITLFLYSDQHIIYSFC